MNNEIKPCPFCGQDGIEVNGNNNTYFYVCCLNDECPCQPETGWMDTEEDARKEWNERA